MMKCARASAILFLGALLSSIIPVGGSEIIPPINNDAANSPERTEMVKLSSSSTESDPPQIPLIGLGVGNLPHNRVPFLLATAMDPKQIDDNLRAHYRLVDTSHTNPALEVLVGRSLGRLLSKEIATSKTEDYHVIIKIWHTHLTYERTMASVHDSLSNILPGIFSSGASSDPSSWKKDPRVKVHAVIQYPRCYETLFSSTYYRTSPNFPLKYSNCREEEDAISKSFASSDPNPLEDKFAWKRSYRALEELYHRGILESIGVSNFGPSDMTALYEYATIGPHVYMGTLQTLIEGEEMVEEMVNHGVHYICYDAGHAILDGKQKAKSAYATLERLGATSNSRDSNGYSATQIVLGWLIQQGIGVVPGTSDIKHLIENSSRVLFSIPTFNPRKLLDVEVAVQALVDGNDIIEDISTKIEKGKDHDVVMKTGDESSGSGIVATFLNSLKQSVRIFRVHPKTGEQIQLSSSIAPGRSGHIMADLNDVLIAYDGHGTAVKKFLVEADEGASRIDFAVEL